MNWKNKKIILLSATILVLILGFLFINSNSKTVNAQATAVHPSLLFHESEIPGLKQKINDGKSFDDTAFDYLISRANAISTYPLPSQIVGSYYGIHTIPFLALAYQLSDDSNPNKYTYRDKCKIGVLYIVDNPEWEPYRGEDPHWQSHRLYSITLGFDMCFDNATADERQRVITELESYMTHATNRWNWPWYTKKFPPYGNNGGVLAGSTIGMASIVMRGESTNTTLLDNALQLSDDILEFNLAHIFDEKGAYTEGSLYAGFAMRFFVPYIEARIRYDGYDYSQLNEVKEIVNWMAYGIRPNQYSWINNLNDALYSTYPYHFHNTVIDWAIAKYNSGVAKWLYTQTISKWNYWSNRDVMATVLYNNDISAVNPGNVLANSELFPHRGLYYYRTGWPNVNQTSNDSVFSLYSGKFWSGHAQMDQGQFALWSKGENFITDTGYGSRFSQAHNLVLIDDKGQHTAGASCGTDGLINHYLLGDFADYVSSDNSAAYNTYSEFNAPDQPLEGGDWSYCYSNANPVQKANRYVLSVKKSEVGEYFVILDDIQKDNAVHKYDWNLHTSIGNTISTIANPVVITGSNKGNKLNMYFINPSHGSITFNESNHNNNNSDGYTKRLKSTINAINPEFFVLLFPKKASGETSFTQSNFAVANGYGAKLNWANGYKDYIIYNRSGSFSAENIASDGRFTLVRKNNDSDITKFSLAEGSSLSVNGFNIVSVNNGTASMSSDGQTINISDSLNEYVIYGPNVSSVVGSTGEEIYFSKANGFVYINTSPPPDTTPPAAVTNLKAR
ncbi:heparinase II/III family protein [Patescibacteria group bacterium]